MKLFGLIGYPLSHSWSQTYFTEKFFLEGDTNHSYRLFPLHDIHEFHDLIKKYPELCGLNVTIPYKEKIIPFLTELDDKARSVGAVNTIKITRTEDTLCMKGYNTDADGFLQSLPNMGHHRKALILGTGGASKAICFALDQLSIPWKLVSRTKSHPDLLTYPELLPETMKEYNFIVNTTPLGMFPDVLSSPRLPYHLLTSEHFLYDLVYAPEETLFLKKGKLHNARVQNGLTMLKKQADLAYTIFVSSR